MTIGQVRRLERYGIRPDDFDKMWEKANGLCRICMEPMRRHGKGGAAIDHDHETGRVRGLLCSTCNHQLGWFEKHGDAIVRYVMPAAAEDWDVATCYS